jgi:dipeptidyl aminopeptidase/acylaminoacyl peptidase
LRYDARAATFVPFIGGRSAEQLDFSRDGQWTAYVSYPDDILWRCRSDGTECMQLTFEPMHASNPRWSPDGTRIVFAARSSVTGKSSVYVLTLSGGKPELLLQDDRDSRDPSWSPDGEAVALRLMAKNELSSLAIYNTRDKQISLIPDSEGLMYPQYSPDERFLAAQPLDNSGITLFNFATRQWRRVQVGKAERLCWSRNGGYVYWSSVDTVKTAIFRMRVSDFRTEPVATAEFSSTGHPGPGLSLAPDDSPLVLRDLNRRAIYAIDWAPP